MCFEHLDDNLSESLCGNACEYVYEHLSEHLFTNTPVVTARKQRANATSLELVSCHCPVMAEVSVKVFVKVFDKMFETHIHDQ